MRETRNLLLFKKNVQAFNLDAFELLVDPIGRLTAPSRMTICGRSFDFGLAPFAQDDTLQLLKELHIRQLACKFLHLVGVGHKGGACVPGAVEELAAGAVGKRELDGFVTHLERAACSKARR